MPTYKDILAEEEAKRRARTTAAQDYALTGALPSGAATKSTSAAKASPTVYQQALASFAPVNYDNVQYRGVDEGFRTANDADKARWAEVIAAQDAGDSDKVNSLLNAMSAEGNFSGYYGDDGLYYGYARGYGGAGNGSYQPVIGGKLISSGELDTNQWLTPDGKAYTGSLGGSLSNQGVWSYGDNRQQASGKLRTGYDPSGADSPTLYNTGAQTMPQPASQPSGTAYERALSGYASGGTPVSTPAATTPYQVALAGYEKAPEYGGNEYQRLRDEYTAKAAEPWEGYDYANDPVFQAYKKQYTREGRRSSEDVMGQYAAMTGGRPSTAAMTAAQQAGNYYSAQIADKIPQLYNEAYDRYLKQYQQMLGIAGQYDSYNQQDYSRYLDRLGQFNTDRNFQYQLNRDAVGDARYDQEWAQKLKEYADAQGWKSTEWEQYLKEYQDKMNDADRQWAYQQYMDAWEMENTNKSNAMKEAEWRAKYGDYSGLRALGIDVDAWLASQQSTGGYRYTGGGDGEGEKYTPEPETSSTRPDYLDVLGRYITSTPDTDLAISELANAGVSEEDILNSLRSQAVDTNKGALDSQYDISRLNTSNRRTNNGIYIGGQQFTWDDVIKGIEDKTIKVTYNEGTQKYAFTFRRWE